MAVEEELVEAISEEQVPQADELEEPPKNKSKAQTQKTTKPIPKKTPSLASTRKSSWLRSAKTVHVSSNEDAPLILSNEEE